MFTQEQIDKLLEDAKPSIIESFKKELTDSVTWDVKRKASELISEETTKWVKENILPEIIKELQESKDSLISVGVKLGPKIVDILVESSIEHFKGKLKNTWDRQKILEVIFK